MRFRILLAAGLASLLTATAIAGESNTKAAHHTASPQGTQQLHLFLIDPHLGEPHALPWDTRFGVPHETRMERRLRETDYLPVMRSDLLPAAFSSQYRADGIPEPRGEVYDRTVREIAGRASGILISKYSRGLLAPLEAVQRKINDVLEARSINIKNKHFGLHTRGVVNFNSKEAIGIETKLRLGTTKILAELYPSGFQARMPALTIGKGKVYVGAYRSFDRDRGSGVVVMYRRALWQ